MIQKVIKSHLQRIFKVIKLESFNQVISADSFSYNPLAKSYINEAKTKSSKIKSYSRNEPRLELIQHSLERMLRFGKFFNDSESLSVNGFRLIDLKRWANYGPISAKDSIGALSSECNCDCEFCHAKTLMAPTLARNQLTLSEAQTRIKYYNPETRKGLPPITRLPLEPFSNKYSLEILKLIRNSSPDELITEETNGSFLTEDVIAQLSELKPVFIILSLNGVSPDSRRNRMREQNKLTQTAMQCPEFFRKYKIPFAISYVPWYNRSLDEIKDVVQYAESVGAARARVCLPVTHRFAHPNLNIDMKKYWLDIVKYVQELRVSVNIPIGTTPTIYEWQTIYPIVCGTVKGSPSAKAGIKYADIIVNIEGKDITTRREARRILAERAKNQKGFTKVKVIRNEELIDIRIDHSLPISEESYPYSELQPDILPFGIDLPLDIGLSDAMALKEICEAHQGKILLLLVPRLIFTPLQQALSIISRSTSFLDGIELHLSDVEPIFYGGEWIPARWWTVSDIIQSVKKWQTFTNHRADVVILPDGVFSPGGKDILGGTIVELEQKLDTEICRVNMSGIVT